MKYVNKKQKYWILLLISIFLIFTFGTFVVIGSFSDYLVTSFWQIIVLIGLILATILCFWCGYQVLKFRRRKLFRKSIKIILSSLVSLYAIGCTTFLFIIYGPFSGVRDWLITTAMATMNHKYLCQWFYSDDIINKVLSNNYIIEVDDETDASLVNKDNISGEAKDEYDREILDHNEGDLYKIIRFKVNGQEAYLAAVYDASKVSVGLTSGLGVYGQYAWDIAKKNNAALAINGGGFEDPNFNSMGGSPIGVTIANGKIITNANVYGSMNGVIGFNQDDVLVLRRQVNARTLLEEGVRDAVTMGPFLIVNGKKSQFSGNGGWGIAARTAIGQRADGIVLFLVIDSNSSRTKGASIVELADIMERYGAINAANLDGGTSSVMVVNGELINDPIDSTGAHKTRGIPTIFMVK